MFTKFKHQIESWLRRIITEEVNRVDRDLQSERASLRAQIALFDATLKAFADAVKELSEVKDNASLRAHLNELRSQITPLSDLVKQLHPV